MSDKDQHIVIGRLIAELSAANQELALARESLRDYGRLFSQLATPETTPHALALVKELTANEALARTQALLEDLARLRPRIAEIRDTLRAAGLEVK